MKKQTTSVIRNICLFAGVALLIAAVIVLTAWQRGIRISGQRAADYVHTIRTLLPEPQGAVPEERSDNTMPVLSVDGTDFVGILELPSHSSALPVCASWGSLTKYPRCFSGSIYDGSLQIGGTSQKGQYDFYREISAGDALYFTDMTGNRYAYAVKDVLYRKHADSDTLQAENAALTLFIKNIYAFEYIIVFCDVLN